MDVNILAQIGFVVLIGLAAKNAILIVEFARQNEEHGEDRFQAATEAARVRLRPILMTSFAFILGVLPLVIATGAGAEMRQSLGTAVFFGMLGVTIFGLIFTPVFYVVVRKFARQAASAESKRAAAVARRVDARSRHQHHAEAGLAAHHARIGFRRLGQRIGLDHRPPRRSAR